MTFRVALTFDAEHTDRPTEHGVAESILIRRLSAPPVLGAARLGLDELGAATDAVVARLRAGLVETAIVRMGAGA